MLTWREARRLLTFLFSELHGIWAVVYQDCTTPFMCLIN